MTATLGAESFRDFIHLDESCVPPHPRGPNKTVRAQTADEVAWGRIGPAPRRTDSPVRPLRDCLVSTNFARDCLVTKNVAHSLRKPDSPKHPIATSQ